MSLDLQRAIGTRVRALREVRGLTQERLAAMIERSVETVSNVERGRVLPGLDVLAEIARCLGAPLGELIEAPAEGARPARVQLETRIQSLVRELPDADVRLVLGQVEVVHSLSGERHPKPKSGGTRQG